MSRHAARPSPRHAGARRASARGDRRLPIRAVLSLGLLLGIAAPGTLAYWTDNATVDGGTFTSGTMDVRLTDGDMETYTSTTLNMTDMAPGSSSAELIKLKNTGTVNITYQVDGAGADVADTPPDLGAALRLNIYADGVVNGNTCSAGANGVLVTEGAAAEGTALGTAMLKAQRPVAKQAAETLCVQVFLPTDAASALQGSKTVVTLTVAATSVAS